MGLFMELPFHGMFPLDVLHLGQGNARVTEIASIWEFHVLMTSAWQRIAITGSIYASGNVTDDLL